MSNDIDKMISEYINDTGLSFEAHPVTIADRKRQRNIINALGTDITRYIIELVTNSDDSYRRMKESAPEEKIIKIELDKDNKNEGGYIISVTDNAEGMAKETLEKKFTSYAGDNAGGPQSNPRGIFGQGGSDVLRMAANDNRLAQIETIKDGVLCICKYCFDKEHPDGNLKTASLDLPEDKLVEFRKERGIPENGTRVSFGVSQLIKFGEKEIESLPEKICVSPYLRYLLNQDNLTVTYKKEGQEEIILSSAKYQFKEENKNTEDKFSFDYEGERINCELRTYINDNKKKDGTQIIVRDEEYRVYDNTMFNHKLDPGARNISGELIIKGFYNFCYKRLNDPVKPEAVINDNRTGFDKDNPFYDALNSNIDPFLIKVIADNRNDAKSISLSDNRQFSNMLKNVNKYCKEAINEEIPLTPGGGLPGDPAPDEAIKFARGTISITKGKQYDLKLIINSNKVSPSERIEISCDSDDKIEFSPDVIQYDEDEIKENGTVTKSVVVKGFELTGNDSVTIKAQVSTWTCTASVYIIESDIHYPKDGFEFYPSTVNCAGTDKHWIKLYVDREVIPIGSIIIVDSDEGIEHVKRIQFSDNKLIEDSSIGVISVRVSGGEIGKKYTITASTQDKTTSALITITEPSKRNPQNSGLISDVKMTSDFGEDDQVFFEPSTRIIYINKKHRINKYLMSRIENCEQYTDLPNSERKYLLDLIAGEIATVLVKEINMRKHNDISFDEDPEESYDKIQHLVQLQKNKIYEVMTPEMLDK